MTDFEKLFSQGEVNRGKLLKNGFVENEEGYYRESRLLDFILRVKIAREGSVNAELYDPETDEPYTLHLVSEADGSFVGEVRKAFESALLEIAESCFDRAVFKNKLQKEAALYAKETYGEEIERLWEKFPEDGILRRKDNRKWYAVFMGVAGNKVGLPTDGSVEIVDVRADKDEVAFLCTKRGFAPAWHMNKKSWITVLLDGSVEISTIRRMLDKSRELALKK